MESLVLQVSSRDKSMSAKQLLGQELIPAEYYGSGVENISLQMDYQTFRRLYRKSGRNTIIELDLDGKKLPVLVHEIQFHPVSDNIIHVDFISVKMGEEVRTEIPLNFVGTSPAVKDHGGTLMTSLDVLEVKCLPKDLVSEIEVDISILEDFNANIFIRDIKVPTGMTVMEEEDALVCSVMAPRVEEEKAVESDVAEVAEEASVPEDKEETAE